MGNRGQRMEFGDMGMPSAAHTNTTVTPNAEREGKPVGLYVRRACDRRQVIKDNALRHVAPYGTPCFHALSITKTYQNIKTGVFVVRDNASFDSHTHQSNQCALHRRHVTTPTATMQGMAEERNERRARGNNHTII